MHNAGDPGSIPGLGRSPGEGNNYPPPVFWPGEFHGLCSPWGRKGSDTTERLSFSPSGDSQYYVLGIHTVLVLGIQQNDKDIHIFSYLKFFSIIGYYKILNVAPCAIQ